MGHTISTTVARSIFWFHTVLDTWAYEFSARTEGDLSAIDAVLPESVSSRFSRALFAKKISETRSLTAGILLGLVIIFTVRYTRSPWRKVPPGPRRLPIIGNALQLVDKSWLFSKDCKERFGESLIIYPRGC